MSLNILILFLLLHFCDAVETHSRVKRIVGGRMSALPPVDEAAVFVRLNDKEAQIFGSRDTNNGYYIFRGIRYAEPPTGAHRFQRPRYLQPEGTINASLPGPPCPQPDPKDPNNTVGDEDCLLLNIYTPKMPDDEEGLPVLLWIHGGGFRYGSASQYGEKHLMRKKMILVTIQYRLGTLGFLGSGTKDLPGNVALFDMAAALKWVEDYIEFFGGNSKKILTFGQGSGASSALFLSLSELTQSVLSGVIAMSGSALSHFALDKEPKITCQRIAEKNFCPITPVEDMVQCLQQVPVSYLLASDTGVENQRLSGDGFIAGLAGLLSVAPVVEEEDDDRSLPGFLTNGPDKLFKLGKFPKIPLLTGVTKDETFCSIASTFKNEIIDKIQRIPDYLQNELISSLRGVTGLLSTLTGGLLSDDLGLGQIGESLNLESFLSVSPAVDGLTNTLGKVAEVTTDALFNLPAFLTVENWGKRAPAFLYSFEHIGHLPKGNKFLGQLPLFGNSYIENPEYVSHGDDLAFLFNPLDIFGNPIDETENTNITQQEIAEDLEVSDVFTDMIEQFARSGKIQIEEVNETSVIDQIGLPSFSDKDSTYVSITGKPKLMKDFRFCQMAMWGVITDTLKLSTCKILEGGQIIGETLIDVGSKVGGVLTDNELVAPLTNVKENLVVPDLFGKSIKPVSEPKATPPKNNNAVPRLPKLRLPVIG